MEAVKIKNFNGYYITKTGMVFNKKRQVLSRQNFKNTNYVRLYKDGVRYTLSVNKILDEQFGSPLNSIKLYSNEYIFRYEESNYYITNMCRVYNSKTRRWLKVFYKKGYPTVNISINGNVKPLSIISFLKSKGGIC